MQMKQLVHMYSEEIKWRDGNYVPTLSEHLKVSMISIGNVMVACAFFVGMDDIPTVDTYKWVLNDTTLMKSFGIFVRLINDLVSTKVFILTHTYAFDIPSIFCILATS